MTTIPDRDWAGERAENCINAFLNEQGQAFDRGELSTFNQTVAWRFVIAQALREARAKGMEEAADLIEINPHTGMSDVAEYLRGKADAIRSATSRAEQKRRMK